MSSLVFASLAWCRGKNLRNYHTFAGKGDRHRTSLACPDGLVAIEARVAFRDKFPIFFHCPWFLYHDYVCSSIPSLLHCYVHIRSTFSIVHLVKLMSFFIFVLMKRYGCATYLFTL